MILNELFHRSHVLIQVLHDIPHGVLLIQKIISSACVSQEERVRLSDLTKSAMDTMQNLDEHHIAYKRLHDELASIIPYVSNEQLVGSHPSPARSVKESEMKAYASVFYPELPTPSQSPVHPTPKTTQEPSAASGPHVPSYAKPNRR